LWWNRNKIRKRIIFLGLFLLVLSFSFPKTELPPYTSETGTLAIYFMQEQVGYEEYSWDEDELGFTLTVRGKMTKPVAIEIDQLVIRLDKSYIPERYSFKGRVSGMVQDILSYFSEGTAVITKEVAGQTQRETVDVKRDAILLPNPMFSPYMVLTKKFRCSLEKATEISAYIIPQMEIPASLGPAQEYPCRLILRLGPTEIVLTTDEEGVMNNLDIPSQNLRVHRTMVGTPIR
jgi:hypothetical protein